MKIIARLENLKFTPTLLPKLKEFNMDDFIDGKLAKTAVLNYRDNRFGISQWVSPKRTRSYPYGRVYDTMSQQIRVTIIPFIKDEGFDGDRDFLQWDTVSLMSLLNVYVLLGYYHKAEKNLNYENKITNQVLDYQYLKEQLDALINYKSSALHWNLSQLDNSLKIAQKCKNNYKIISKRLKVKMHSSEGIDKRIKILKSGVKQFKDLSRSLATEAQNREFQTTQPKEKVIGKKAKIIIKNYLGGLYYLTVDEVIIKNDKLFLIEKKHSKNSLFPSISDIKDGIVKMMLFVNLAETKIVNRVVNHFSILGLTSAKFKGFCHNKMSEQEIKSCLARNEFLPRQKKIILSVFNEGKLNDFLVFLMDSNNPNYRSKILNSVLM
ncbi:MAG: hypothetical protein U9R23_08730 [Candidatus Cloacimonadota bacterium]|nr:hypothetical protein [Candidatus Cloacimonadota bacterium]